MWRNYHFWPKNSHLRLKMWPWGLQITSNLCLNIITIPFRLLWMHFDHGITKFRFSIFSLSRRLCRGYEVTVGCEDVKTNFKFFWMTSLFRRGQVEHVLTMENFKLNPSLFTPHPIGHFPIFWSDQNSSFNCHLELHRWHFFFNTNDGMTILCTAPVDSNSQQELLHSNRFPDDLFLRLSY